MKLVTATELAAIVGVSKQAIANALKSGKITKIYGKIDLHAADTVEYINLRTPYRPAQQEILRKQEEDDRIDKAVTKAKQKKAEPKKRNRDDDISESMVDLDRNDLEKQKIIEQVLNYRVKTQQQRNELIDRSLVKRAWAKMYAVDTSELHPLGEKIASDIAALCKVEDTEIVLKIKHVIDSHIFKALQHSKRLMDDFLKKVGEDEISSKT